MTCRNQNYRAWEEGIGSTWRERARSYTSTGLCFVDSWSCAGGLSSIVAGDGPCPLLPSMASVSCRRAAVREAEAERREAGGAGARARATSRGWEADWIGDASQVSCRRFCRRLPLGPAGSFPRFSVPARASFPRRYSRSGQHHYFPLPAVPPQRRALPRSSSRAIFQRQDAFFPDSAPFNRCGAFRRTPRRAQRLNERIPLKRNIRVTFSI